jgi:DNA processing protein
MGSPPASRACEACLRRTWLVSDLADHLARASPNAAALDAALGLPDQDLVDGLVPAGQRRERLRRAHEEPHLLRKAEAAGLEPVCRHDGDYPRRLRDLAGPPAVLFLTDAARTATLLKEPAVAVVGARRASAYGLEVARALGRGPSAAGVTVVSGMALGIDSAAHAGARERGARTVAVLAGGADVAYPATKRQLHARLRAEAVVASDMPPGFRARRWCFPARNRIIAALSDLSVVVEAGERSGALITAQVARELGREVGAVPGRVTAGLAAGTNTLIRDGAHVILGAQDALDVACGVGVREAPGPRDESELEPRLRAVLDAVRAGRDSASVLARTRAEARAALAALAELELRGYLTRAPGGRYEVRP